MINMPYNDIVERIKEEKDISDEDLQARIQTKMDQLSGLISKEGAAYIVANDLGVKLVQTSGPVKIKNIVTGQRSVETAGKVTRIYDLVEFEREKGTGRVRNFMMADETGQIRVTAWHDQTDLVKNVKEGDIVKIMNGFVKGNQGQNEIHLNANSKLIANPPGVEIKGVQVQQAQQVQRKKINELKESETAEIFATIVQAYDPRFFEQCPECRKRPVQKENGFACEQHGTITPTYSYVTNVVLDDGSDSIRVVMFREQMQQLYAKTDAELQEMKNKSFEELKTELLGEQIIVAGKVIKNEMFDRLELRANKVQRKVDPEDEIKKLQPEKLPSVDDL